MKTLFHKNVKSSARREAARDSLPVWLGAAAIVSYFTTYAAYQMTTQLVNTRLNSAAGDSFVDYKAYFSFNYELCALLLILLGALASYCAFSFLFSEKKLNVFMSRAYTRRELFFSRVSGTLVPLALSIFLPLAAALVINAVNLGPNAAQLKCFFELCLSLFTSALIGFAVFTVCLLISGTRTEGSVAAAAVLVLPGTLTAFFDYAFAVFLRGCKATERYSTFFYTSYQGLMLKDTFAFLNPLKATWCADGSEMSEGFTSVLAVQSADFPNTFTPAVFFTVAGWLAVSVAAIVLSHRLFEKRKIEFYGFRFANKGLMRFLAFTLALALSTAILIKCEALNDVITHEPELHLYLSLLIFAAGSFLITLAVYAALLYRRRFVKALRAAAVTAAAFTAVPLVLLLGGFGFTERVPDSSDVVSAVCSVPGINSVFNGNYAAIELRNKALLYFESESDIEKITDIHSRIVSEKPDTAYPVLIYYKLRDGTVVKRVFKTVSTDNMRALAGLASGEAYVMYLDYVLSGETEYIEKTTPFSENGKEYEVLRLTGANSRRPGEFLLRNTISVLSADGAVRLYNNTDFPNENMQRLSRAVRDDIADNNISPFADRRDAICALFISSPPNQAVSLGIYIYPEMKRTLNCLAELGLMDELSQISREMPVKAIISDITIPMFYNECNNFSREHYTDDGLTASQTLDAFVQFYCGGDETQAYQFSEITEKAELERMLPMLVNSCYTGRDGKYSLVRLIYSDAHESSACIFTSDADSFISHKEG